MPTPIEEGWFWWRKVEPDANDSLVLEIFGVDPATKFPLPWEPVRCYLPPQRRLMRAETLRTQGREKLARSLGGEWGERIPDNDRLKAMRQVVRRDPMHTCNVTGARLCYYCGGNQGPDAPNPERRDHAHDCPWRRAQEGTT